MTLEADRQEIDRFVGALFRYADSGTYTSLRAFRDDADETWHPELWPIIKLNGDGLDAIIDHAWRFAARCAGASEAVVFAPPIATFNNPGKADVASLANGLCITVELDADPAAARLKLEATLGPPTVVVASGGEWIAPPTGEVQPKLHIHWRLDHPTRTKIDHDFLREIRRLATKLAGGDATSIPLVHPLRWPGSWHRKKEPRLARIVEINPDIEITLADALNKLRGAAVERVEASKPNGAGTHPHQSSEPQADPLDIAAALGVIPNAGVPWDQWNAVGMAIWRATGGSESGFATFCAWSTKSSKFDAAATRARWDHYRSSPPDRIGAGSLFRMAREARRDWRKPSDHAKQSDPPPEFNDPPPPEDVAPSRRRKPNGGDAYHFHLVRFAHIKLDTSPSYLVKGLIPREGLVLVWGPPKCGKTFWTFDLAMHIALGWEYRGRSVEAGTVVYIACKGERGLAARSEAFRQKKITESGADPPFFLLTTRLDLGAQVDALTRDVAAQIPDTPCAAIVLDTLNRSIRGSESNDEDMSGYIAAADALRDRFKCAVIIIHHCGIDASRPRGHTSLTGAVDAQIAVKRDAAGRIITTVEWMKDGPEGDQIVSRLAVTDIGDDEDGEAMTSCVVEADDEPQKTQAPAKRMSPKDQIALDALHKAIAEAGEKAPASNHVPENARGVTLDTWRRYYLLGSGSDGRTQDARWKAFQRSRDSLQAHHAIQIWGDFVWTT